MRSVALSASAGPKSRRRGILSVFKSPILAIIMPTVVGCGALGTALILAPFQAYAVSSKKARYDSGTITQIPKTQIGILTVGNSKLCFEWKQGDYAIPYASIVDMEYGDTPSARIGRAIGVALVCSSCGIKAEHHLLTLEFTQGTTKQAVVLELGKALPQSIFPALAIKTGKRLVYQQIRAVTRAGVVSNYRTTKDRVKPKMGSRHALELTKTVTTENELDAIYGPPNYIGKFNPDQGDERLRDSWPRTEIFIPATLIDALPAGTKMVINRFNTASYLGANGVLVAYIDTQGEILGWSYSVSLDDDYHYLEDLPLWRDLH